MFNPSGECIIQDGFVKSTEYSFANMLLSTSDSKTKLNCFTSCESVKSCSMVTVKLPDTIHGQEPFLCKFYRLENDWDIIKINQSNFEVWYKKGKRSVVNPCPVKFTRVGKGCYHNSTNWRMTWHESKLYCENIRNGVQLAEFLVLSVS